MKRGQITDQEDNSLTTDIDRTHHISFCPKVHKDASFPPGRPTVSGSEGPTQKISQFVDFVIDTLVPKIKSYTRDSINMIRLFSDITDIPTNAILCTLDLSILYTNISYKDGINTIQEILTIHRASNITHNSYIMELLRAVLVKSYFDLNGKQYHQLTGTAMITNLSPSYAKLFICNLRTSMYMTYK